MKWRFIFSVVIYAAIAELIHTLGAIVSMKYYLMPEYFPVWSKLMMPNAGPPPANFYYYSILSSLIMGVLFVFVYWAIRNSLKGRTHVAKGLYFGLILVCVSAVHCFLSMILLINLPSVLLIAWLIENIIIAFLSGMIFSAFLDRK